MFTGIVQSTGIIHSLDSQPGFLRYSVALPSNLIEGIQIGASISIDGVCQTVTQIESHIVHFDAIEETLNKTTIGSLMLGEKVNIERAAKFGDEIGGHVVSGHVFGKGQIIAIDNPNADNTLWHIQLPSELMKYIFAKGFIAINGCSLTIVEVNQEKKSFVVSLIPETLSITTFSDKKIDDWVNIEIDSQTQTIVETVERILAKR